MSVSDNEITILVVDDEPKQAEIFRQALEKDGYTVYSAHSGESAIRIMKQELIDIVITDLRMPHIDGLELFRWIKRNNPETAVLFVTAYATVETAVDALKSGAKDYLIKPVKLDELRLKVKNLISQIQLQWENIRLKQEVGKKYSLENIIGTSKPMQEVFAKIRKVAPTSTTVLLRGESGTGKELVAQAIHALSPRSQGPFVKATCAALPEGLLESELFGHVKGAFTGAIRDREGRFELANTGTIFLDEIGDIPLSTQVKLLRVLQERQFERVGDTQTITVDVRVIAATNKNLEEALRKKEFREDLYYRLNVVSIYLPPLRERKEDIPALIDHFLTRFSSASESATKKKPKLHPTTLSLIMQYHWPGNIRELENAIEHALVMGNGEVILPEDLPIPIQSSQEQLATKADAVLEEGITLEEMERRLIQSALLKTQHNQSKAAKLLGITRRTLGYRMKKYKIE
ncbi:MAG: sigma-54 dependent transcriptional regulator [bacterium]|nr:sigma-54 dependent transcriptional regulator [bacterium]